MNIKMNWSNYSWERIPEKIIEKHPIYESPYRSCPRCLSSKTYPIMNMIGSTLACMNCKNSGFEQRIIGYKNVLVEK